LFLIAENATIAASSAASSRLEWAPVPNTPRRAHVDHQVDRAVALLDELLDVGGVHARRHVPVDDPDVVAGDVGADVGEHQGRGP
jgi:hypothetical protein